MEITTMMIGDYVTLVHRIIMEVEAVVVTIVEAVASILRQVNRALPLPPLPQRVAFVRHQMSSYMELLR